MSLLDDLQKKLDGYFNQTSGAGYVKIFDTPCVWGQPFGQDIMPQAQKRATEFESAIVSILKKMRYRCDISSLNAPDEAWRKVILSAIDTAFTEKVNRTAKTQIRFLFAQTPTSLLNGVSAYFEGTPEYVALKQEIIDLIRERRHDWEYIPEIWIGRFYRIAEGLKVSFEKKLLPDDMISEADTRMTWNHTKIIAVDGHESFVGGHNLNMDLFRNYPPVHDVSVKVLGEASLSAQLFLNKMWEADTDLLTKEFFDDEEERWVNADGVTDKPEDPLKRDDVRTYVLEKQREQVTNTPEDSGYTRADRMLSVGKYWSGPDMRTDYQKGAEVMKEFIIKNAKKKIRMSQQDLVSAWKKQWQDHHVCRWIIDALLSNPELKVQIVVSALDAAAGAAGDQYSFGSGARRTFELFKYYLTHDEDTDEELKDPDGARQSALERIEIAPFFFTDNIPEALMNEGDSYKWPAPEKNAFTATLKEPSLIESPPQNGRIGRPFWSLVNASGLIYPKVPPAPGNHAKVTIIDDELYVVGSDNMYPGYLSEFNYLIEGQEAVKTFIETYWEPLWKYSGKHAFNYKNV